MEEKIKEQERKIANNSDLSKNNEILFQNIETLVANQKIENEARAVEVDAKIARQEEKTASMLSTIFTDIIRVVRADEARTQELEGKILTNLEEKIDKQKNETGSHMTRISWLCLFC